MDSIQLGLDTFGDVTHSAQGVPLPYAQVIRNVVAEGVLADEVGVDALTLGEHHRDDFAVSTPETVLAAIAAKTSRIILSSGVTVLSSDDPVRVFQRFATLDAISEGRAEIIMGRGSFTESFPLFGYRLDDYQLLLRRSSTSLQKSARRAPLPGRAATERPFLTRKFIPSPTRVLSARGWGGGSPESVVRAANYGFPLMLAIIGGASDRFAPYVDLYHRALEQAGHSLQPVGVHSPGHIADTDEEAIEQMWPAYQAMFGRIGRERGWAPMTKESYLNEVHHGALYVGSVETVAAKIAHTLTALGVQRFDFKYSTGPMSHDVLMNSIELYGTKVIPMVKDMVSSHTVAMSA